MVVKSTLLLLFALITVGCVPPPPVPNDIPKVDAFTVLDDYTSNEERANREYKGKWFTIRGIVDKVDTGGTVYLDNGYRFEQLYMDFDDTEDTLRFDAGDRIEAHCVIRGVRLNLYMSFRNCRLPQQEPKATAAPRATPTITHTRVPADDLKTGGRGLRLWKRGVSEVSGLSELSAYSVAFVQRLAAEASSAEFLRGRVLLAGYVDKISEGKVDLHMWGLPGTIIMDFGPAEEVPQLKQYDRITAACEIGQSTPELTVLLTGCNEFVVPDLTENHNNLERDLLLGCLETHGIHSSLMRKFDQHGDKYLQDIPADVIGTHITLCRYHGGVLYSDIPEHPSADTDPATTLPTPDSYARVVCNPEINSPGTKTGAGKVAELEAFIPPAGFKKFHDRLLPVLRDASQVGERVTGQPISRDVLDLISTLAGDFSIRTRPPSYSSLYSFLPAVYDLNQESKAALLAAGCLLPSF